MSRHDIAVLAIVLLSLAIGAKLIDVGIGLYIKRREAKALRVRNDRLRKYGMLPYEPRAKEKRL